ncbi:MAG: peptidoglycan DD-metalloendopeptidase family protein [Bacteroidota bacterium]
MYRKLLFIASTILLLPFAHYAQPVAEGMGVMDTHSAAACISPERRSELQTILAAQQKRLGLPARGEEEIRFIWPVRQGINYNEPAVMGISNYVDHNEDVQNLLLDFSCGRRTYDLNNGYNHSGTDIFTWPFSWEKMDRDQVEVVAAAEGVIIFREDNQKDRNCSFNSDPWNAVYVQHADGTIAWYGHLKRNSLTDKQVGDSLAVGEYIGVVGSSGSSTGPHLHFEVQAVSGDIIDPYVGSCNPTTDRSWWQDQPDYRETQINDLRVHDAEPVFGCSGSERPNEVINLQHGQMAYFVTYFRDQLIGSRSNHRLLKPDGSEYQEWSTESDQTYNASYWWRSFTMPSSGDLGQWTFVVSYQGVTYRTHFYLTDNTTLTNAQLEQDTIHLGELSEPTTLWRSFELTNTGTNGLEVESIHSSGTLWVPFAGYLEAGETKTIHFRVKNAINATRETMRLRTSAGDLSLVVVGGCSGAPITQQRVLCTGDSFSFGDQLITEVGEYQAIFTSSNGCDSVVHLTVTGEDTEPQIEQEIGLLSVDLGDEANYQWVRCDDPANSVAIPGATRPTYVPTEVGSYAVQITQGSCTFTSNCVVVTILGLEDPIVADLTLYPNPTSGQVTLALPEGTSQGQYWAIDMQGRKVLEGTISGAASVQLQLPSQAGLYAVYFQEAQGQVSRGMVLVK